MQPVMKCSRLYVALCAVESLTEFLALNVQDWHMKCSLCCWVQPCFLLLVAFPLSVVMIIFIEDTLV